MTDSSQPPPGFRSGFVAPPPVYGVEQPDGTIARAQTVAEGAAAVRARVAANAGLQGAAGWRRASAGLIDLALGIGVTVGLDASQPMSIPAMVGVALGATFFIRIVVATMTGGASPGRLVTATRAVDQDATRLSLSRTATRECFVLFYVVTFPWWLGLLIERIAAAWSLYADGGSISTAPVPQDRSTGTTVASVGEVNRVRARDARAAQAAAAQAAAAQAGTQAARDAAAQAGTQASAAQAAAATTSPRPAVYDAPSSPPSDAPAHTAARPALPTPQAPRLAAAPFIPADLDPDVAAAQASLRAGGSTGGLAVHTMQPPEIARRMIAATIDYALIVSISGFLVSSTALSTTAVVPGLGGSADPRAANGILVTLLLWFFLRPAAIAAVTQTLGQWLMHYRVYAPRGERVDLGKALLREASGWGILVVWAWAFGRDGLATPTYIANADLLEGDSMQARLSHDRIADTWPVRI